MVNVFSGENGSDPKARERVLSLVAFCVGGMVIVRALDNANLANEIRESSRALAHRISE